MPVTAKLSRAFYDRFGDEVVNELVSLLNLMDSTYVTELRQQSEASWARIDANFSRFEAKVDQRFAEQDAKWERRFADLETRLERHFGGIEQRFPQMEARWERRLGDIEQRFPQMESRWKRRLGEHHVSQVRWMVGLWAASTISLAGLILSR